MAPLKCRTGAFAEIVISNGANRTSQATLQVYQGQEVFYSIGCGTLYWTPAANSASGATAYTSVESDSKAISGASGGVAYVKAFAGLCANGSFKAPASETLAIVTRNGSGASLVFYGMIWVFD